MTAQLHEVLLLNGERWKMRTVPDLPHGHARLVDVPLWVPEDPEDVVIDSTACWRQYVATWEIRDARLYLRSIRGRYAILGEQEIWAAWYSGELLVHGGDATCEQSDAYGEDLMLTVREGIVTTSRPVSAPCETRSEDARIWEDLTMFEDYEDDGY
jgi:hypothetical protein